MANKISVILEVVGDGANRALGNFRKSIQDADGATNKFKAGASSAFSHVKANAGEFAVAAGAALVAFGVKAIGAFQETALEAGKLRDSLGLSAEEASRYIEVAGDLGIEVGALEATIGRMNREAANSPEKFDEIGAAIARNQDGTINVNQTFLNTVDALNKIPDAAKRAAAGQEIFGRSWMKIAEMVEMGATSLEEALEGIETGKIIDDQEIQRARDYRDAMDNLKGISEELTVEVGSRLVPVITDLAEGLQLVIEKGRQLGGIIPEQVAKPLGMVADQVQRSLMPWKYYTDFAGRAAETTGKLGDLTGDYIPVAEQATVAAEENAAAYDEMSEAAERGTQKIKDAIEAYRAAEAAQRGLQSASLAYRQQVADTAQAVYEGTLRQMDATLSDREREQAARDVEAATLAQAEAAVALAEEQAAANGATMTADETTAAYVAELERLAAYLSGPARAEIQAHIDLLNNIPASKTTTVVTQYANRGGTGGGVAPRVMHDGGIVGGQSFAGLKADEVPAVLQKGEAVLTRDQQAAMAGGGGSSAPIININMPPGSDGDSVVRAIRQYVRLNGPIQGIT